MSDTPPPLEPAGLARLYKFRALILLALLLGFGAAAVASTKVRFDFTPQRIFQSGDDSYVYLQRVQKTFGRDDNLFLVHVRAPDVFAPQTLEYLRDLHEQLAKVEGVQTVEDLTSAYVVRRGQALPSPLLAGSVEEARTLATEHPLLSGRVLSKDATATLVVVQIDPKVWAFNELEPVVNGCMQAVEKVRPPPGVESFTTGIPAARVLIAERLIKDQIRFFPVCTFLFIGILWLAFRDLRAVAVPLFAVLVAATYTAGLMVVTGETINIINNVLPVLIFVIAMSDAIHVIGRYRRELAAGIQQPMAIWTTVKHLAVACMLTSVTTAVGFASLVFAKISILKWFGLYAALGVLIAYVITVVFVPVVFSFMSPKLGDASIRADGFLDDVADKMGAFTLRFRVPILGLGAILIGACAWLGTGIRAENNIYEAFPADDPLVEANVRVEEDFAGIVPISLVCEWDEGTDVVSPEALGYLFELQTYLEEEQLRTLSVIDLLAEWNVARHQGDPDRRRIPDTALECKQALFGISLALEASKRQRALERLYQPEARMLRITALAGDSGSSHMNAIFDRIDARLAADAARQAELGLRVRLSGDGPVASRGIDRLIWDLFSSLLLAFAVIFPIMCLLLRSFRAGLVSMIPNMFPLVLVVGFMALAGIELRVTSVIVFTISLGLAVDDTIHFMARFREEWRKESGDDAYERALARTFRGTGAAIVLTTLLLGSGFSALLLSSFPISQTFALCMLVTVVGALIGDVIILPAALSIFKPFRV